MKKQRRGLNRYNMLQGGKKRKTVSIHIHMHDTCTLKIREEKQEEEKKDNKNGVYGIRTHIHENSWLLLKTERATNCAIESLENFM